MIAASLGSVRSLNAFRWVFVCLGLATVFGPGQARAEDADQFVKRGIELRRKAKDVEALAEFKKAWAIEKAPRIEAQMALAEQALGLWVTAEEHLLDALGQKENDTWTMKNHAALTSALKVIQNHLGTLDIWGTPAGAAIFVNEKPSGTLPIDHPLRISDESVILRARAEGFLEWTRTVRVDARNVVRQHVEMVPLAPATSPTAPPLAAREATRTRIETRRAEPSIAVPLADKDAQAVEGTATESSPTQSMAPGANDQASHRALRPYAWAAGAGALLAVGLGVFESFAARNKTNQFNGLPECGTSSLTNACRTIQDDRDRAVTVATVGYVSGSGLAILSAVLFVLSSGGENPPASVARACVGAVALRGFSCSFSF